MKQPVSKAPTLHLCPFPSLLSLSRASHEIPSVTVVSRGGGSGAGLAACLPACPPPDGLRRRVGGRAVCRKTRIHLGVSQWASSHQEAQILKQDLPVTKETAFSFLRCVKESLGPPAIVGSCRLGIGFARHVLRKPGFSSNSRVMPDARHW